MNINNDDAQKLLEARLDDYIRQSDRGELVCGNFLTPQEIAHMRIILRSRRAEDRAFFFGGYDGAERKRIFVIPSYISELGGGPQSLAESYFAEELAQSICPIRIKGSGFRSLSHRDYLGSILSLGIERREVGDIVTLTEHEAIAFASDRICDYLLTSLERIASDKVKVAVIDLPEDFKASRKTQPISDTVASKRFDCIVGALLNLSREKAQNVISAGLCEIDHLPEIRVDRQIDEGATISVRGYGKFSVISFDGETRRGRIRMSAEKYI